MQVDDDYFCLVMIHILNFKFQILILLIMLVFQLSKLGEFFVRLMLSYVSSLLLVLNNNIKFSCRFELCVT